MSGWTEERVAHLHKLIADGYSASQIARALGGTTRNSVISKAYRSGLSLGGGSAAKPGVRIDGRQFNRVRQPKPRSHQPLTYRGDPHDSPDTKRHYRIVASAQVRAVAIREATASGAPIPAFSPPRAIPLFSKAPKPFTQLSIGQDCRYGLDDPGPGRMDRMICCADPADEEGIYCAAHAAVCSSGKPVPKMSTVPDMRRARGRAAAAGGGRSLVYAE